MTEERVSPLRQRMIEDMRIRGMGDKAQKSHIRAIKDFTALLGRSPDTATPEDLRAYQLHMTDTGVTPSTFNVRIVALWTCPGNVESTNLGTRRCSMGNGNRPTPEFRREAVRLALTSGRTRREIAED
ncbi:phage integrase N-terminal SAM-like domain-containing protein, partial [Anianabacter salinae]|uniref:phage integrase N-terminal SAM-like domain-containing protein n=1 Tax=Anianabacter salinae TaxID=2851023 RepID=UPI00225E3B77